MGCLGKWRLKSPVSSALEPVCHFTSRALGAGYSVTEHLGACTAPKDTAWMVAPRGFSWVFPHLCCPLVLDALAMAGFGPAYVGAPRARARGMLAACEDCLA